MPERRPGLSKTGETGIPKADPAVTGSAFSEWLAADHLMVILRII